MTAHAPAPPPRATGVLTGTGWPDLAWTWSHDRAHAFFSGPSWNAESLGVVLAHLIVRTLPRLRWRRTVAVNDTLFKRRGKKMFGTARQHDGAARVPSGRAREPFPGGQDHRGVAIPVRLDHHWHRLASATPSHEGPNTSRARPRHLPAAW